MTQSFSTTNLPNKEKTRRRRCGIPSGCAYMDTVDESDGSIQFVDEKSQT